MKNPKSQSLQSLGRNRPNKQGISITQKRVGRGTERQRAGGRPKPAAWPFPASLAPSVYFLQDWMEALSKLSFPDAVEAIGRMHPLIARNLALKKESRALLWINICYGQLLRMAGRDQKHIDARACDDSFYPDGHELASFQLWTSLIRTWYDPQMVHDDLLLWVAYKARAVIGLIEHRPELQREVSVMRELIESIETLQSSALLNWPNRVPPRGA